MQTRKQTFGNFLFELYNFCAYSDTGMTIKNKLVLFLFLTVSGILAEKKTIRPIVTTPLGKIEGGVRLTANSNKQFYSFEGIPYAKPPIGALRYEEPQDPEPWTGIWKANVVTRCLQYDHLTRDGKKYVVHGDEDCLYANVYTHSLNSSANLDVLLYIHMGAFMFGSGATYGPDFILDRNIVMVSFNYRLGLMGSISTEDDVLPGNLHLKDQIKALTWVKENIHLFGGNPNSVTIHGLSAGSASVHLHYLIPASKGLFNRGISESGCALNPWVIMEKPKEKTEKLADLLGCPTGNSKEIKDCLKSKPARQIVQTVKEFQPWLYNPFSPFGVVVDGQWSKNPVLHDHPYNLLKNGKVQDKPWMVSFTTSDGLYPVADFYHDDYLAEIDTKWNDLMPLVLDYNSSVDSSLKNEISQKIRKHYLGDKPVNKDTYPTLVQLATDRLFVADIETAARLQSAANKSPVFTYLYNYRGTTSLSEPMAMSTDNIGVCHGDDTLLILKIDYHFHKNELSSESDKKMSKFLIDMTTSFMKEGSPSKAFKKWTALSKNPADLYRLLKINNADDVKMAELSNVGDREFWDSLPLKENANF